MKFTLEITCNNAAFADDERDREVANILLEVSNEVEDGYIKGTMRDTNGNPVGVYKFYEEDDE